MKARALNNKIANTNVYNKVLRVHCIFTKSKKCIYVIVILFIYSKGITKRHPVHLSIIFSIFSYVSCIGYALYHDQLIFIKFENGVLRASKGINSCLHFNIKCTSMSMKLTNILHIGIAWLSFLNVLCG